VIADPQEPASLNPLYLQGRIGYEISELGYTYATNYDSYGNVVPDVAVAVPSLANGGISTDGKRVTYRLRRDVTWQDGVSLNSRDIVGPNIVGLASLFARQCEAVRRIYDN